MFKVINKDTRMTPFIVNLNFEHVIADWDKVTIIKTDDLIWSMILDQSFRHPAENS